MTTSDVQPTRWWLAGRDADDLITQLDALAAARAAGTPVSDTAAARTGADDARGPARLGIVDPDDRKIRLARRLVAKGEPWRGRSDIWFTLDGLAAGADGGKIAFLFPGVESVFIDERADLPGLGRPLGLPAPGVTDEGVARQSVSIFEVGGFLDGALRTLGVEPDVIGGHSIGEWTGAVAAGMLAPEFADEIVAGTDLDAVEFPDMDFAAISAGIEAVEPIIAGIEGVVVSHDNCPSQSVICGPPAAIATALETLKAHRILGYTLGFQSGFHTPAVAQFVEDIRPALADLPIGPGTIPMWSATLAGPYPETREEILELEFRHLVEPVRFRPMIERLYHDVGVRIFVQVGIGSLTGFVDDTLKDLDHATVPVLVGKRTALEQMARVVTALWVDGVDVRAERLTGSPAAPGAEGVGPRREAADATPEVAPKPTPVPVAADGGDRIASNRPVAEPLVPATAAAPPAGEAGAILTATASPYALGAAAELLSAAAQASQQVIDALADRLSLPQAGLRQAWPSPPATTVRPRPAAQPAPTATTAPATSTPAATSAPAAAPATAASSPAPPAARPPAQAAAAPTATAPAAAPVAPAPAPAPAPRAAEAPDDPTVLYGPPGCRPWPSGRTVAKRILSLENMPETVDHGLYHQREGWPDPSDTFPIVAMTTQIDLLQNIAAEYGGGRPVVEVDGVRNMRWLEVSDPVEVDIAINPQGDDKLTLAMGQFCRLTVRFGEYAAAPAYVEAPLAEPHDTRWDEKELFDLRIMFHGPRYQGVTSMGPIGTDGMLAEFEHLDTPGSLLDNLGKMIAYWVIDHRGYIGEGALPTGLGRVEFFGPYPEPGTPVRCDVRVQDLQRDSVRANGELILPDGTVWCRVENWTSLVFHLDEMMERVFHRPVESTLVEPQPGGWNIVRERWPNGTSREMTARRYLNREERESYNKLNLMEQRRSLLDLIAAKDSVRLWLDHLHGWRLFPGETVMVADGPRRYRALKGEAIPEGYDFHVTVCPLEWAAVAIANHGSYLDIEARIVPEGGDAEAIAKECAAMVAERNPGMKVDWVAEPELVVSSLLGNTAHIAAAWTARPEEADRDREAAPDEPTGTPAEGSPEPETSAG